MALPIPASEIAVGDYIPEEGKGTVQKVYQTRGTIHIVFVNGNTMDVDADSDAEFMVEQGGRF
jgi:hypothetical protein